MRFVQLILAVVAIGYVAGRYLQERGRLARMQNMSGREARAYYERHRRRYDRVLLIMTITFCTVAVAMLGYATWVSGQAGGPATL